MKIIFRVDSSTNIGSGHVMRCIVLAQELKARGFTIEFGCLALNGSMISYISELGFDVRELSMPLTPSLSENESSYSAWLLGSESEDADNFLEHFSKADLVITDHYAIGSKWQSIVKKSLDCKIMAIDDLGRNHCAEIILDQTLGRVKTYYQNVPKALTGTQYALLSPVFSKKRNEATLRSVPTRKINILVSMGGVDRPNATLMVLKQLTKLRNVYIRVLLNSRAPNYALVKSFCRQHSNVTHSDFETNMAEAMINSDIAVGAPGTTSWERACLGLPNVVIPIAENQNEVSKQLVQHDASVSIELKDIESKLNEAVCSIHKNWHNYHVNNLLLCDGLGVFRVATEVEQLLACDKMNKVSLINAIKSDIHLVYEWQCNPSTRKYALNSNIPTIEEHTVWMEEKLKSSNDFFYMIRNDFNEKVGVIRLDFIKDISYLVSVYISPEAYGRGYAFSAMKLLDKLHPHATIVAKVLKANVSSQKLFEKLEYNRLDSENFIRNPLR